MENTGTLLFDNANSKYYIFAHGKTQGPLTAEEIYEMVEKREATLLDHIWRTGWTDFKRIMDEPEFKVLVPKAPESHILKEIQREIEKQNEKSKKLAKSATPPAIELEETEVSFYLYFEKTQYGPFSKAELERVISAKKIDDSAFVWIAGWKNWKSIKELPEFTVAKAEVKPEAKSGTKSSRKDKRISPRKPLVARLFVTNESDVIIAVCRDISVGGMQVLTDRVPGPIGTKVKLNVSPSDQKNVKGFVAEGEIVRLLEDGRGFSFRFTKLSTDVKKAIQLYVD